ncbi:putative transporter C11D3.18C [Diplodia seriata]|uniref:Putative transporter C11D3.18C n=1 Tax=Diplodia seriata TaxID=420778 RepID=A0A1S8B6G0_9PEZI|nr:putative transporter C11D3.18C [Diplodia seriata]
MEAKIQVSETSDSRPESLDIDYEAEKKLLRKLDWHILPIVAPLYVFSFLDRINIGNGRLYGLEEDLNLSSMQFSIALSVFFVTYVIVEIPSNLIIKRVGASRWIPFITFTWGVIATCTGLAQKFQDLVALRLLLGLFEGGFVPGIQLYLTSFYTKKEMAMRVALFMISPYIAGAFGGLLAYAIGHMDGYLGYRGWRWIMILEGIPTSALAVLAYLVLADSPTSATYLTPAEKTLLLTRQHRSNGLHPSHPHPTTALSDPPSPGRADVLAALSSPHTWAFAAIGFCSATVNYGYSIFLPTLLHGLYPSWSTPHIQAMTIPCYGAGVAACLLLAYVSDRLQRRGVVAAGSGLVACAGYVVLIATDGEKVAGYAGCVVVPVGMGAVATLCVAWQAGNVGRYGERAVGLAVQMMGVNTGGVMMSYIYPKSEGPRYRRGHSVTLSLALVAVAIICCLSWHFARVNRRRAAGKEDWKLAGLTPEQIEELGDRSPHFVYTA